MSKKANLITLRKNQNYLNLITESQQSYLKHLNFLKIFLFFLQKKGIWAILTTLNLNKNVYKFYINVYFTAKKIRFYKFKLKPKKTICFEIIKLKSLTSFLSNFLKKSICFFNIKNLNKNINKPFLLNLNFKIKKYKNTLFQRRFNLYYDTLKLITLFSQKQVHTASLLFLLSTIFKYLSKKLHGRFLTFLEIIIYSLVYNKFSDDRRAKDSIGTLSGLKFRLNGKIKGKMRASSHLIIYGKIPNQSIHKGVEYAMVHTFTRYGAFGMKAWIYK